MNDPEVLTLWRQATVGKNGGDRRSEAFKSDNIPLETKQERGNSRAYALVRLKREDPALHAEVGAGTSTKDRGHGSRRRLRASGRAGRQSKIHQLMD